MKTKDSNEVTAGMNGKQAALLQLAESFEKSRKFSQRMILVVFAFVGTIVASGFLGAFDK
jgi:lipopolysaccharide/colanic/teichoic acid biosynthesis glycosyltransferase